MNGWFVTALVFLVLGGIALGARAVVKPVEEDARKGLAGVAGIGLGIGILFILIASVNMVGTKKVGIVTSFGKPVGNLSNGLHFVAPWQKVSEMDAAIQTDSHDDTEVKLSTQASAFVDSSIRWRIKQDAADALFRDYQDLDRVRTSLVTKQLQATLGDVFVKLDPLAGLNGKDASNFDMEKLSTEVADKLRTKVGTQVEILGVILRPVKFDDNTQRSINELQSAQANTRIAEQKKATAQAEADANRILADSVSKDPNVLVSKCLDIWARGTQLPAGGSCWNGGGNAVVIPSK